MGWVEEVVDDFEPLVHRFLRRQLAIFENQLMDLDVGLVERVMRVACLTRLHQDFDIVLLEILRVAVCALDMDQPAV